MLCPNAAYTHAISTQRQLFWHARQLLLEKHYKQFEQFSVQLKEYPLYPYLHYMQLQQQRACQQVVRLDKFLNTYKNTLLAHKMRTECLMQTIQNQDWQRFIHYYRPVHEPVLQCYHVHALLKTHQKSVAYKAIPELWLDTYTPLPQVCQHIFSQWEHAGKLTRALLWKKLQHAIQRRDREVTQHLMQWLSANERRQLDLWYQVYRHPEIVATQKQWDTHDPINKKILLDGMHRLANKNPDALVKKWILLTTLYPFNRIQKQDLLSRLAIALARQAKLNADFWLKQVKPTYTTTVLREWRVRHALLRCDWNASLYWINHLTQREQKLPCWRYWQARALAQLHQTTKATQIYKSLASEVDYYAILASQHLKQAYSPLQQRIVGSSIALQQNQAMQRAKELYVLGFTADARREWLWALPHLSITQSQAAAQLAKQWQWYDLAILAAAKAKMQHDIQLRFPKVYPEPVLAAAKSLQINAAWIWAIMRQESAFRWNAKSRVGALGLMQIMPKTGLQIANSMRLTRINLLDPMLNIRCGAMYLKRLLALFDGNLLLATAAYNVGPTRLKNYQALYQTLPQDVWVEILPWKETRDYVKRVVLARHFYR